MLGRLLSLPDRLAAAIAARPTACRAAFAVGLTAVLAFTVVRYVRKVDKPSDAGTYTRSAFLRWRPQIEALDRGEDIYANYEYPNPPIMALVLRPLFRLPPPADAVAWLLVKAGLAAVMCGWAFRLTAEPRRPLSAAAKGLAVLLALHPILGDLSHGNVNIFIAFLVFAALELVRRRLDLLAGVTLALAIACKVTPALFVPYFGWKAVWGGWTAVRQRTPVPVAVWRGGGAVLAGCAAGLGLWLVAVPGAALGFDRNQQLLASWYNQMVRPFLAEGKVRTEYSNQSIPGLVHGFFTDVPLPDDRDDDDKPQKRRDHLVDLGPAGAKRIVFGCQLGFVAAVFFLCRAPLAVRRQGLWVAAECALVTLGMLLFSERTWKHHATTLILPMAVLVAAWGARPTDRAGRLLLAAILIACTLLVLVPSVVGGAFQNDCLEYGTHTAAFLLLAAAVCAVMRWEATAPRGHSGGTSENR